MALKKCKECGDKVSTQAKVCPHCGAKVSKPTSMFTWLVAIFIFIPILVGIFSGTDQPRTNPQEREPIDAAATNVPVHTVASNTSLAPKDGRRIVLHSANPDLTKAECSMLINQYLGSAGPEGQISVHKPSPQNNMTPWCVENFDDKGIFFNDNLFYTL